jgi:uncharacterized membrane protein YgcG
MRWTIPIVCFTLLFGAGLLWGDSGPIRVVMEEMDVTDHAVSKADAASLTGQFEGALNGTGRFLVVPSGNQAEASMTPFVSRSGDRFVFGARVMYWGKRTGKVQNYSWPFDRYLQVMEQMPHFAHEIAGQIPEIKQKKSGNLLWVLLGVAAAIGGGVVAQGAGSSGGGSSGGDGGSSSSGGGTSEPGGVSTPDLPTPPGRP